MSAKKTNNQYMVVAMIDSVDTHKPFVTWPQHLTLVPWFVIKDIDTFSREVSRLLRKLTPFTAEITKLERWGRLTVFRLRKTPYLQNLHETMLDLIEQKATIVAPFKHRGKWYTPHITKKAHGLELQPGQSVQITSVTCVKTDRTLNSRNRPKEVVATWPLGEGL